VWFAAFADHCSFFPTAAMIGQFQKEVKPFRTFKGTIQFPVDKPLPAMLVKKMVKARITQIEKQETPLSAELNPAFLFGCHQVTIP
jgi:uncharacterized protein YdhG (YjbR/CyaY superfamily)